MPTPPRVERAPLCNVNHDVWMDKPIPRTLTLFKSLADSAIVKIMDGLPLLTVPVVSANCAADDAAEDDCKMILLKMIAVVSMG